MSRLVLAAALMAGGAPALVGPAGWAPPSGDVKVVDLSGDTRRQVVVDRERGQYLVRLMDNHVEADCAHPGLEVLPDGTFAATTYGHWTPGELPNVVSVRLRLAELDGLGATP
jgi:hypothetical protein